MILRLGTRRSNLAVTQSTWVADLLRQRGHEVELVQVVTEGDVNRAPLTQLGGTGVFAAALRRALRDGEVDFAVHSLKDLPTAPEPELVIAAVPRREDPRDVLVSRDGLGLGELRPGARVGTGSPRRAAQLVALGLGIEPVAVRGNVETRLGLVGELDGVLLARAGLARIGRLEVVSQTIEPGQMLPAAGQGALAVECRQDREDVLAILAAIEDADTRAAVTAERAMLARLEAGCTAAVGALAEVVEDEDGPVLSLRGFVGSDPFGDTGDVVELRRSLTGALGQPQALGQRLADLLLEESYPVNDVGAP